MYSYAHHTPKPRSPSLLLDYPAFLAHTWAVDLWLTAESSSGVASLWPVAGTYYI